MNEAGPAGSQDSQSISDVILIPAKLYTETIQTQRFFWKATPTTKQQNNDGNFPDVEITVLGLLLS